MAEESKNDVAESIKSTDTEIKRTEKKKKGVLSALLGALFGVHGDDFEKRLQHISKEEAAIMARITMRSHKYRRITRQLISFSVLIEVIAVGYAIITTRSIDLNWKMRASRVSPMFLFPALSYITYSLLRSFSRMLDRKDRKTLENLQAERQAKINELKEKTNYYTTQQLIQRYDPDPAAKAAAATVLASKLGADSGLKLYVGDDYNLSDPTGKSNDVQVARTTGLRQRRASHSKTNSTENGSILYAEEEEQTLNNEDANLSQQHPLVIENHPQTGGLSSNNGGWIARIAAMLVGEDPTQSYALICRNCHMHNGLARKEDFPYITYYCPHCNALNGQTQQLDNRTVSASNSPTMTTSLATPEGVPVDKVRSPGRKTSRDNKASLSGSPVAAAVGSSET
ncbi:hypothetical protein Salat_0938800 [Sesamum alatum]|uniref:Lunapark zinc ribbon domain-containing protein n=1 Tax=Sesamum alatum TaxID=300844 RepID=A0AAE1YKM4_9LAMI|nr:hypothetical protein Salat_0938800 [Sesamum alatum]